MSGAGSPARSWSCCLRWPRACRGPQTGPLAVEPEASSSAAAETNFREQRVAKRVVRGDTLPRLLMDLGVSSAIRNRWLRAVVKQVGVADVLRAGDTVRFHFIAPWGSPGPGHMTALQIERAGSKPLTWQLSHHQIVYHRDKGLRPTSSVATRAAASAEAGGRAAARGGAETGTAGECGEEGRHKGRGSGKDAGPSSLPGGSRDARRGRRQRRAHSGRGTALRDGARDARAPEGRKPRTRAARQGGFREGGPALDSSRQQTVFAETVVSGPEDRPLLHNRAFPGSRPSNPAGLADRIEARRPADVAMDRWADRLSGQESSGGGQGRSRARTATGKDPGCRRRARNHPQVVTPCTVVRAAGEGHTDGTQGPDPGAYAQASGWSPGRKAKRGSTPSTHSIRSRTSSPANACICISKGLRQGHRQDNLKAVELEVKKGRKLTWERVGGKVRFGTGQVLGAWAYDSGRDVFRGQRRLFSRPGEFPVRVRLGPDQAAQRVAGIHPAAEWNDERPTAGAVTRKRRTADAQAEIRRTPVGRAQEI